MATGKQHVKTPTGWNATQGAWVKTGGTTWKAAEQIYVKTPSGWNNASGQSSVQQPYPYIANSQTPYIANAQQPYPYIAASQSPYIANAQQPYPYIANSQTPYIANRQNPYPYIASNQTPYIANAQQPYPYIASQPTTYARQGQTPSTYQNRSPFTYRSPVSAQQPYIANARTPYTYNARTPFTYNARTPFTYSARTPFTYNARYPANAQSPSSAQQPFTFNARSPFTYQVSFTATYPANGQNPYTFNIQTPYTFNIQTPYTYDFQNPYTYYVPYYGGGGGCFIAGTQVWMANNTYTNIEDVVVGDSVMTFDFDTMKLTPQNVMQTMIPRENIKVFNVELSNGRTLGVTGGHPIHTDSGWKYANQEECDIELKEFDWGGIELSGELEVGDEVFTREEHGVTVKSITENGTATVYHLSTVENTKTYFAEGVLVHNGGGKK